MPLPTTAAAANPTTSRPRTSSPGPATTRLRATAERTALNGSGGNDNLDGGTGNDNIDGGGGDDSLTGGSGRDSLIGGSGTDTADYSRADRGVTVTLDGVANDGTGAGMPGEADNVQTENVTGGTGADRLDRQLQTTS